MAWQSLLLETLLAVLFFLYPNPVHDSPEVFTWGSLMIMDTPHSAVLPCQSAAGLEMNGAKFGLV